MRLVLLTLAILLVAGCTGSQELATLDSAAPGTQFTGLPSPGDLLRQGPPRGTSGAHSPLVRLLRSDGAEYVPWPNWSANAEVSGSAALIHGGVDSLNYVLYALGGNVDSGATLTRLMLDFSWDTEPMAPEGLYIGLADQANDRWVWLNGEDARNKLLELDEFQIHGVDAPGTSYIAVVNYSGSEVALTSLTLRFATAETVIGDEWLYLSSSEFSTAPPSIVRVRPDGSSPEVIVAGAAGEEHGMPQVINHGGEWKLNFVRAGLHPQHLWRCDIEGGNEVLIHDAAPCNPIGHLYGTDRGLFLRASGPVFELWGYSPADGQGRVSRDIDFISSGCWDLSVTAPNQYGAIASQMVDQVNGYSALVSIQGAAPFPSNATPMSLYARLPEEDARGPEMLELATLAGDPRYYIYYCARNRDDATFNIYRLRYPGLYEPEPVVIDATDEVRWLAVSPNGEWLAYMSQADGSPAYSLGQIHVRPLLDPSAPPVVVAQEALYAISWYDPTP